jgi:hypothetical protein
MDRSNSSKTKKLIVRCTLRFRLIVLINLQQPFKFNRQDNFNSSYSSPVNYNDKDFNFRYTEFENLFSPTTFVQI